MRDAAASAERTAAKTGLAPLSGAPEDVSRRPELAIGELLGARIASTPRLIEMILTAAAPGAIVAEVARDNFVAGATRTRFAADAAREAAGRNAVLPLAA